MIIAFDIGGSKISAALMQNNKIIARQQRASPIHSDIDQLLPSLYEICDAWVCDHGIGDDGICDAEIGDDGSCDAETKSKKPLIEGIGIATTGHVQQGEVIYFSTGAEHKISLSKLLETRYKVPVNIINDACAAAWGEFRLGKHFEAPNSEDALTYITVSTGIGGGIINQGKVLSSKKGLAGHLGHTSVSLKPSQSNHLNNDTLCACGRKNCIETYASGTAIAKRASQLINKSISCKAVFEQQDNEVFDNLLNNCAEMLAEMIANVTAFADSPVVVIGGSVGLADRFIGRINKAMATYPERYRPQIRKAHLNHDADLYGAALLISES